MLTGDQLLKLKERILLEKALGKSLKANKDVLFRSRNWIDEVAKDETQYKSKMYYTLSHTRTALRFHNQTNVQFETEVFSQYQADNLSARFEYDFNKYRWGEIELLAGKDIDRYGKGFVVVTGWNEQNKTIDMKRISPRSVYPDPSGHGGIQNWRFFGFDREVSLRELKQSTFANKDKVVMKISHEQIDLEQQREMKYGEMHNIDDTKTLATLYYHYTKRDDGEPVLAIMCDDEFLDILTIPGFNKHSIKPFPVVMYYSDSEGAYGMSLLDIMEDEMRLESLLTNMIILKTVRQAAGNRLIADRNTFGTNIQALANPSLSNNVVLVDRQGLEPFSNLIYEQREEQIGPDAYNMLQRAEQKARENTSIDVMQQGMANRSVDTATEASLITQYSNIAQALEQEVLGYGREDLAWIFKAMVSHYYDESKGQKVVKTGGLMGHSFKGFTRKDVVFGDNFDVSIINKAKLKVENEQQLPFLREWLQVLMLDPNTPPFRIRMLKRLIANKQGLSKDESNIVLGWLPEEDQVLQERDLLSMDLPVLFTDMERDWLMCYDIYKTALPSKAKEKALEAVMMAYQMQQQGQQNMTNYNDGESMGDAGKQLIENAGQSKRVVAGGL